MNRGMRYRGLPVAIAVLTMCTLGGCARESDPESVAVAKADLRGVVEQAAVVQNAADLDHADDSEDAVIGNSAGVVVDPQLEILAKALRQQAKDLRLGPPDEVPIPKDVGLFVTDISAARVLGKALFWDQQVGSDGQACATCHFHAGADSRTQNQLNPGFLNGDFTFGNTPLDAPSPTRFRANYNLVHEDFPFHKLTDPDDRDSRVLSDTNDVASSQGVFNAFFVEVAVPFDIGAINLDGFGAVFNVDGVLVRNVEPRNTPTMVNAVFNRRNFWDGRARQEFNGVNPIGSLDPNARIAVAGLASPSFMRVRIETASLASQAVGPPQSDLEMSFAQRRLADVGRKMLDRNTVPLALQRVHVNDSLLGPYSSQNVEPDLTGLNVRYAELVQKAFRPNLWNAPGIVVDVNGPEPKFVKVSTPGPRQYTLMEWNFSLFFGLAVNLFESTLVSDRTPFDQFMDGNRSALTAQQLAGLDIFIGKGRCVNCHGGSELTNASVRNAGKEPIERMIMGNGRVAVYDNGFYNIGVRPTREDLGVGARIGPLNLPLSDARRAQECVKSKVDRGQSVEKANDACKVPRLPAVAEDARILIGEAAALLPSVDVSALLSQADAALAAHQNAATFAALVRAFAMLSAQAQAGTEAATLLSDAAGLLPDPIDPGDDPETPDAPPLQPNERIAADGMFKAPSLRNVELTAPYFHNGGQATLAQVVQFYNRGGDFSDANQADLDPDIQRLNLTLEEQANLVAFLKALTDERVRFDREPFDHPSLGIPNGGAPGVFSLAFFPLGVLDDHIVLPEVGRAGSAIKLGTAGTVFGNFLEPLQ